MPAIVTLLHRVARSVGLAMVLLLAATGTAAATTGLPTGAAGRATATQGRATARTSEGYRATKVVTSRQVQHPVVIGHRGDPAQAPEETLPSFQAAIDDGADVLEFDIRWTEDGAMVAMHDATLDRTTNCSGTVESKTLAEIRSCDAGSWQGPQWAGTQVPTMQEIVALAKQFHRRIVPELKPESVSNAQLNAFAAVIADAGLQSSTVVQSFDADAVRRYSALKTGAATALVSSSSLFSAGELHTIGASYYLVSFASVTAHQVRAYQTARVRVWLFTVKTVSDNESAIALHPDGIVTNDVAETKNLLL